MTEFAFSKDLINTMVFLEDKVYIFKAKKAWMDTRAEREEDG